LFADKEGQKKTELNMNVSKSFSSLLSRLFFKKVFFLLLFDIHVCFTVGKQKKKNESKIDGGFIRDYRLTTGGRLI